MIVQIHRAHSHRPRLRRGAALGLSMVLGIAGVAATSIPSAAAASSRGWSPDIGSWVTDLSTDQRLAAQPAIEWEQGRGALDRTIVVDPTRRYQTMTGFGASMTDSAAYVLSGLPAKARKKIMKELFSRSEGIGLSMLRQPMGASDFAVGKAYSYDDQPAGQTDPDLSDFSIDHDRTYILPRLREAYKINPQLTFMATPWSAPGWMKTSGSLITGSLLPTYEDAYAQYFVKFIKAYRKAGIPTHYVSMQNEPLYQPGDYPGMGVFPPQEAEFIGTELGPALRQAGLRTKILAYDHNWDIPDYPEAIRTDRTAVRYSVGTAWHCYAGEVVAQSVSHNDYPRAQSFETECSGGDWQGSESEAFARSMGLVINVPRNWGQSVMLWNLALDDAKGPHVGGCTTCRGVVTVHRNGRVIKNLDYWALGQASRFVRPGAVRIGSSSLVSGDQDGVHNVAFRNPDGSLIMIAHNAASTTKSFDVAVGERHFSARLAAGAAATYRWRSPARLAPSGSLGWVDLDFGRGPRGTPSGRLVQSVGTDVLGHLTQVRLDDHWLIYSTPYAALVERAGPATTLSRDGWEFRSAGTVPVTGEPFEHLTDGDRRTRWSSGKGQDRGMSLTLDLGQRQTFTEISLDSGSSIGDYVRRYLVQVSDDGLSWHDIARGPGRTGEMIIALPPTTARHVRLVSAAEAGSWWSIHELNLRNTRSQGGNEPFGGMESPGVELVTDSGQLAGETPVVGYYNAGQGPAAVPWPIEGFDYTYRLPPTAAVTFAVSAGPVDLSDLSEAQRPLACCGSDNSTGSVGFALE